MSEHSLMTPSPALAPMAPMASRLAAPDEHPGWWRERDGVVILDARGCITFCSSAAADLLGGVAGELAGQQITALIPELPFGRYTPEFNLAYVYFHGADGVWARRALLIRDGRRLPVDVSLGSGVEVGKRSIVLILQHAAMEREADVRSGNSFRDMS